MDPFVTAVLWEVWWHVDVLSAHTDWRKKTVEIKLNNYSNGYFWAGKAPHVFLVTDPQCKCNLLVYLSAYTTDPFSDVIPTMRSFFLSSSYPSKNSYTKGERRSSPSDVLLTPSHSRYLWWQCQLCVCAEVCRATQRLERRTACIITSCCNIGVLVLLVWCSGIVMLH